VVAAVPYVHEYRLGLRPFGLDADEVRAAMTTKIRELYTSFADIGTDLARGAPLVATGHLTCLGSQLEDAPVEIHRVGNLEGFPGNTFDPRFQYVALGHIHRPQRVGQTRARYSGSPMAMNVREALTPRQVILVDVHDGGDPTVTPLSVPVIRSLVGLRGELDDVVNQLQRLSPETDLPPYVQVEVLVKHYQPSLEAKLREALAGGPFAPVLAKVHQVREMATEAPSPRTQRVRLADLSLEEVFRRRCVFRNEPADDQLLGAFRSVVSEIQTAETDP
jgi:exonuclease SbcD